MLVIMQSLEVHYYFFEANWDLKADASDYVMFDVHYYSLKPIDISDSMPGIIWFSEVYYYFFEANRCFKPNKL